MLVLLAKVTAVFVVLTTTLSGCSPGCENEEAKRCATSGENAVRLWYPKVSTSPTAKTILCRSVQEYYTCMKMSNCCYQDDEFKETHEKTQEKMFFVEEVGVSFKMIRDGAMCTGANAITGVCELEPLTVFR